MKQVTILFTALFMLLGVTGCDWDWNSSDDGWSDSYSWVNFSGTYRANGSYLISAYSTTGGTGTVAGGSHTVSGGTVAAGVTVFSGNLGNSSKVLAGSVTIVATSTATGNAAGTFRDTGSGGITGNFNQDDLQSPQYAATGSVDYNNGKWTINLNRNGGFVRQTSIIVTYTLADSTTTTTTGTGVSGTSSKPVYSFTVSQTGNVLSLVDSNGKTYSGKMGSVSFTSDQVASSSSSSTTTTSSGEVVVTFSASGYSAAGYYVTITGTFQGRYSDSTRLSNRLITGTWIEKNGKTGSLSGKADAAATTTST